MTTGGDLRAQLLRRETLSIAAAWATRWLADMQHERRVVNGGWPGTVPEARARAQVFLDAELGRRRMPPLSAEELATATQLLYEHAKRQWLDAAQTISAKRAGRRRSKAAARE